MASLQVKVGTLSEKEGKGNEGLWGIRGTVYGKAKGKQNGSRLQGLCENDRKYMQERDR